VLREGRLRLVLLRRLCPGPVPPDPFRLALFRLDLFRLALFRLALLQLPMLMLAQGGSILSMS